MIDEPLPIAPAPNQVPGIAPLYTVQEIADVFKVTPETVRNWIITGKLKGAQINNRQYRVRRDDLMKFAKSHYGLELA